jgi:hypothetical protein
MSTATAITFIIPVCHPANAKSWASVKNNLAQTVKSIASQSISDWNAIIVANRGADLPALPSGFDVKWVNFPPNPLSRQLCADQEQFYDGIRIDKGRRVLAGMLHAGKMGHVMVVDADDLISNRIASFVAYHREESGWFIREGFAFQETSRLLLLNRNFHKLCGTSHIVRSDLYRLPQRAEDASEIYINRSLGSHIFIEEMLRSAGTPLTPLPFAGAIYRMAHPDSVTKSRGIIRSFFWQRALAKSPLKLFKQLFHLRVMTTSLRSEYFG